MKKLFILIFWILLLHVELYGMKYYFQYGKAPKIHQGKMYEISINCYDKQGNSLKDFGEYYNGNTDGVFILDQDDKIPLYKIKLSIKYSPDFQGKSYNTSTEIVIGDLWEGNINGKLYLFRGTDSDFPEITIWFDGLITYSSASKLTNKGTVEDFNIASTINSTVPASIVYFDEVINITRSVNPILVGCEERDYYACYSGAANNWCYYSAENKKYGNVFSSANDSYTWTSDLSILAQDVIINDDDYGKTIFIYDSVPGYKSDYIGPLIFKYIVKSSLVNTSKPVSSNIKLVLTTDGTTTVNKTGLIWQATTADHPDNSKKGSYFELPPRSGTNSTVTYSQAEILTALKIPTNDYRVFQVSFRCTNVNGLDLGASGTVKVFNINFTEPKDKKAVSDPTAKGTMAIDYYNEWLVFNDYILSTSHNITIKVFNIENNGEKTFISSKEVISKNKAENFKITGIGNKSQVEFQANIINSEGNYIPEYLTSYRYTKYSTTISTPVIKKSCPKENNGNVKISVSNITPPVMVQLISYGTIKEEVKKEAPTGSISFDYTSGNLSPGTYLLKIFNDNFFYDEKSITIENFPTPVISSSSLPASISGCKGTATLSVSTVNTNATYSYSTNIYNSFSNTFTNPVQNPITLNGPGYYWFKAIDGNGCKSDTSRRVLLVNGNSNFNISAVPSGTSCFQSSDGKIKVTPPVEFNNTKYTVPFAYYKFKNGLTNQPSIIQNKNDYTFTNLDTGTYKIRVSASGTICYSNIATVKVEKNPSKIKINSFIKPCPNLYNGEFTVSDSNYLGLENFKFVLAGKGKESGLLPKNSSYTFKNLDKGTYIVKMLNASNCEIASASFVLENFLPPSKGVTISGETSVCADAKNIKYSIPAIDNANKYIWTISSTTPKFIKDSTTFINVSFNNTKSYFDSTFIINVAGWNRCGTGGGDTFSVKVKGKIETPTSISGPEKICQGVDTIYSITKLTNATNYHWTLPEGATITKTSKNKDSIFVDFSNTAKGGDLTVYGSNGTCQGELFKKTITVNQMPAASLSIDGDDRVCQGYKNIPYNLKVLTGNISATETIIWDAGDLGTSSGSNNVFTLKTIPHSFISGKVKVKLRNSYGCYGTEVSKTITGLHNYKTATLNTITACSSVSVTINAAITDTFDSNAKYKFSKNDTVVQNSKVPTYVTSKLNDKNIVKLQVTDTTTGCYVTSSPITVKINPLPKVSLVSIPAAGKYCKGSSITFKATKGYSYEFFNPNLVVDHQASDSIFQFSPNSSEIPVKVIATDGNICKSESNIITTKEVAVPEAPTFEVNSATQVCGEKTLSYMLTNNNNYNYYWSLDPANGATISGTNPKEKLIYFPNKDAKYTIKVYAVNDICTGLTSSLDVAVTLKPSDGAITGSTVVCQGTNSVTYTTTITGAKKYIWSLPEGVTPVGNTYITETNTIVVNFSTGAKSGDITVKGNNGTCDGNTAKYYITVNPTPAAPNIIADDAVCQGQTNVAISDNRQQNAKYIWKLSSGLIRKTNDSLSAIQVNVSNIASRDTVKVYAQIGSCKSPVSTKIFTIKSLPVKAIAIKGNDRVCENSTPEIYSCAFTGATSYSWTLSNNLGTSDNLTTSSVSIKIASNSGIISVRGFNECGYSIDTLKKSVEVIKVPLAPALIKGESSVCVGTSATYYVDNVANATSYQWSYGSNISSADTTKSSSISLNFNSGTKTDITVLTNNGSCIGSSVSKQVTINPLPSDPPIISGSASVCPIAKNVGYEVKSVIANAISYEWELPTGMTLVSGEGTNKIFVNFEPNFYSGSSIKVRGINSCGTGSYSAEYKINLHPKPAAPTSVISYSDCKGNFTLKGANPNAAYIYNIYNANSGGTLIANNTSGIFASMGNGKYYASVEDGNTCESDRKELVVTIEPPPGITKITPSNVACYDARTGSIAFSASGGNGSKFAILQDYKTAYTNRDTIKSFTTDGVFKNLGAGNHKIIIKDAYGCSTISDIIEIRQPQPVSFHIEKSNYNGYNISCNKSSDGSVEVYGINGGLAPFTQKINSSNYPNYIPIGKFNNLKSGVYTVTVKDSNACTYSQKVTLSEPDSLYFKNLKILEYPNKYQFKCPGSNDGRVQIEVVNAVGKIDSIWTFGGNTVTWNTLRKGINNFKVTDANKCSRNINVNLDKAPADFNLSISAGLKANDYALSCNGATDATITSSISGGTSPYTYVWRLNNGAPFDNRNLSSLSNNVGAGNYTLDVTDNMSCSVPQKSISIFVNSLTVSNEETINPCFGSNKGSIKVKILNGLKPYVIKLKRNDTLVSTNSINDSYYTFNNLVAANYTVLVEDPLNCTYSINILVSNKERISAGVALKNPDCAGFSNGSIGLYDVRGGNAFLWKKGTNILSYTGTNLTGLTSGSYSVRISEPGGCFDTFQYTLSEPSVLTLNSVVVRDSALCGTARNGSFEITASGGTGPYQYFFDNNPYSNNIINSVSAGNHNFYVKDDKSCTTATITRNMPTKNLNAVLDYKKDVSIKGRTNGIIRINGSVSGRNYQYSINNGSSFVSNNEFIVKAGVYNMKVKDVETSCVSPTLQVTITEPEELKVKAILVDSAGCGKPLGRVSEIITGRTREMVAIRWYRWNNNKYEITSSNSLYAGKYKVEVIDTIEPECFAIDSIMVPERPNLIVTASVIKASCPGMNNGSTKVTVQNGRAPFSYIWNDNLQQKNDTAFSLSTRVNPYRVTVSDAFGCEAVGSVLLQDAPQPVISSSVTNATCGRSDGKVSIIIPGNNGSNFRFNWEHRGDTIYSNELTGLRAGSYQVKVIDNSSCSNIFQVTISNTEGPVVNARATKSYCGLSKGTAKLFVTGGLPPFEYSWKHNNITFSDRDSVSNLKAGYYSVIVTDKMKCSYTKAIAITDSIELQPEMAVSITESSSCSKPSGSALAQITRGRAPFSYSWGGTTATGPAKSNIPAGTHTVTGTDALGCKVTETFEMVDRSLPLVTVIQANDAYCGLPLGTAEIKAEYGIPPYKLYVDSYEKEFTVTTNEDSSRTIKFGNLLSKPAPYAVYVADKLGCKSPVASFEIRKGNDMSFDVSIQKEISCFGISDGEAIINMKSGEAPFTYIWNNTFLSNTAVRKNLAAGIYQIRVVDNLGCAGISTFELKQPERLTFVNSWSERPTCFNNQDGNIFIEVVGGKIPYSFNWNNGNTTKNNLNVLAGTHNVEVKDLNNCKISRSFVLTQPEKLKIDSTLITPASCAANLDGSLRIYSSGGNSGKYFTINNSAPQTWPVFADLRAQNYLVRVKDANSCKDSAYVVVTAKTLSLQLVSKSDATCFGHVDGKISVKCTNGSGNYSYSIDNGITFNNTTGNFIAGAGTYNLKAKDIVTGCESESFTVNLSQASKLSILPQLIDSSACGLNLGKVKANVSGGSGVYSIAWFSDEALSLVADANSGLASGKYYVQASDLNSIGCSVKDSIFIPERQAPVIDKITLVKNPYCGQKTGIVAVKAIGGSPAYTFKWNDGVFQDKDTVFNLPGGSHTVYVKDRYGCIVSGSTNISDGTGIIAGSTSFTATCGQSNAKAVIQATGDNPPFKYSYLNKPYVSIADTIRNLGAGSYSVLVSDAIGCTERIYVDISNVNGPQIDTRHFTRAYCDGANGTANVTVSKGTPPYIFEWKDENTIVSNTISAINLKLGKYSLKVSDANNCITTTTINILDSLEVKPEIEAFIIDSSSCSVNSGKAGVNIISGVFPVSYVWNNNPALNNNTAEGLYAGANVVSVRDANGCNVTATVTMKDRALPKLKVIGIQRSHCKFALGSATILLKQGVKPYTVFLNNKEVNAQIIEISDFYNVLVDSLLAGNYKLFVKDKFGCLSNEVDFVIRDDAEMQVFASMTERISCSGRSDGQVSANTINAWGAVQYVWNDTLHGPVINNLPVGEYRVLATDATGCKKASSIIISEPLPLVINNHFITNPTCVGAKNGSIRISVNGGTSPYSYSWSNFDKNSTADSLPAGTYNVIVTDNKFCQLSGNFTLKDPVLLKIDSIKTLNASCSAIANGSALIYASGGSDKNYYSINGGAFQFNNYFAGLSTGKHQITVRDLYNCLKSDSFRIGADSIQAKLDRKKDASGYGLNDGQIKISGINGSGNFTFSIEGSASQNQTGIFSVAAGTYTIGAKDLSTGCESNKINVTISQPTPLFVKAFLIDSSACGANLGKVDASVNGGSGNLTINWYDAKMRNVSFSTNALKSGKYYVKVTDIDAPEITAIDSIEVPERTNNLILQTELIKPSYCGKYNGAVTVKASGGYPGYSYSWNDKEYQKTDTAFNLKAGAYTVVVSDRYGCSATDNINITDGPEIKYSLSLFQSTCGNNNGKAVVSVLGNNPPYKFTLNGQIEPDSLFSELKKGTYFMSVTDKLGCKKDSIFVIDEAEKPVITKIIATKAFCGKNNGEASVEIENGVKPYRLKWYLNNALISEKDSVTQLAPGNYKVSVSDSNGCEATTVGLFTIRDSVELMPSLALSIIDSSSCNKANGKAEAIVSGGLEPYFFSWQSGNIKTAVNTGLVPGWHKVDVSDSRGCQVVGFVNIRNKMNPQISLVETRESYCSLPLGSIKIKVANGVQPFTCFINGKQSEATIETTADGHIILDIKGLKASLYSYDVFIIDSSGCNSNIVKAIISEMPVMQLSVAQQKPLLCFGDTTAVFQADVINGRYPFKYFWNNIEGSEQKGQLFAGVHMLKVVDSIGCSKNISFSIADPVELTLSNKTISMPSCPKDADGSIEVFMQGGTGAYSYFWSNGATGSKSEGLQAGSHNVVVKDGNSCTKTYSFELKERSGLAIRNVRIENPRCAGKMSGSVSVDIRGGSPGYSFDWVLNDTIHYSSGLNLGAGRYKLTVKDQKLCSISDSFTLTDPPQLSLLSSDLKSPLCAGASNGIITVEIGGGKPNYYYSWNNKPGGKSVGSLTAGFHELVVYDNNYCSLREEFYLDEPSAITVSIIDSVNPLCNGAANGSLKALASGGSGFYNYFWNDIKSSDELKNIKAGRYRVAVTDTNNCYAEKSIELKEPQKLSASAISTSPVCYGFSDGSISITASGGLRPYRFNMDTITNSTGTFGNLSKGIYTVDVFDYNGCKTSIRDINVINPPAIVINMVKKEPDCYGLNDGNVTVQVQNGTQPFIYKWSNLAQSSFVSGLKAGKYDLELTDARGCKAFATTTLNQPDTINITNVDITMPLCSYSSNGSISLTPTGGTLPYNIVWKDNIDNRLASSNTLKKGKYKLQIIDKNRCSFEKEFVISAPEPLNIQNVALANPSCYNYADGSINAEVSGGTKDYSLTWTDNLNTVIPSLSGVKAGTYNLKVLDANNCMLNQSFVLHNPQPLSFIKTEKVIPLCYGSSDGAIKTVISGGNGNCKYYWNNSEAGQDIFGIAAGIYSFLVKDENNCELKANFELENPKPINVTFDVLEPACYGSNDGSVVTNISNGVAPYRYIWKHNPSLNERNLSQLRAGTYELVVRDFNNCEISKNIALKNPDSLYFSSVTAVDPSCFGFNNGSINYTVKNGTPGYTIEVSDSKGLAVVNLQELQAGIYSLKVKDAKNCTNIRTVSLKQPEALSIAENVKQPTCYGYDDARITAFVSGGTGAYTYLWNGIKGSNIRTGIKAGLYKLEVSDEKGCGINKDINVPSPEMLVIDRAIINNPSCFGFANGSVSLYAKGGVAPYNFLLDNKYSGEKFENLKAGSYDYTITDLFNCSFVSTQPVVITDPDSIYISGTNAIPPTCLGYQNGKISFNVVGGSKSYTMKYFDQSMKELNSLDYIKSGKYLVKVSDSKNCTYEKEVVLNDGISLNINFTEAIPPLCFGNYNGIIRSSVLNGTAPYKYQWSNNRTTSTLDLINAGTYRLKVTDNNTCESSKEIVINDPPILNYSIVQAVNPLCFDGNNGYAEIAGVGGTPPYMFKWQDGTTSAKLQNLHSGKYNATISDNNKCSKQVEVILTDPLKINSTGIQRSATVCPGASFDIDLGADWKNGFWILPDGKTFSGKKISCTKPGTYYLNAITHNDCEVQDNFNLQNSDMLINADFLMAESAHIGDTVVLIDISWPLPQNIYWDYPTEASSIFEEVPYQHLVFGNEGTYEIKLVASDAGCSDTATKNIVIIENNTRKSAKSFSSGSANIKNLSIAPNPNRGNFIIGVELTTEEKISIELLNLFGSVLFNSSADKEKNYSIPIDTDVMPGVYIVKVKTKNSEKSIQVFILKR